MRKFPNELTRCCCWLPCRIYFSTLLHCCYSVFCNALGFLSLARWHITAEMVHQTKFNGIWRTRLILHTNALCLCDVWRNEKTNEFLSLFQRSAMSLYFSSIKCILLIYFIFILVGIEKCQTCDGHESILVLFYTNNH